MLCSAAESRGLENPGRMDQLSADYAARAQLAAGHMHRRTHNMQRSLESIAVGQSLAETFQVVYSVSSMATPLFRRHMVISKQIVQFEVSGLLMRIYLEPDQTTRLFVVPFLAVDLSLQEYSKTVSCENAQ